MSMETAHKRHLIKNRVKLLDLIVNEEFISYLRSTSTLSRAMVEDIEIGLDSRDGESLKGQIVQIVQQPSSPASSPLEEEFELPSEWPLKDWGYLSEIMNMKLCDQNTCRPMFNGGNNSYPMNAPCKGRVIVINNEEFVKKANRKGTDRDANSLRELFLQMGFDVLPLKNWKNLTATEIRTKLKHQSQQLKELYDCSSFICAILSHGTTGNMVIGVDEDEISVQEIKDIFCKCKALSGKPKIFIVQACQGEERDEGCLDHSFERSTSSSSGGRAEPSESLDPSAISKPPVDGGDFVDGTPESMQSSPTSLPTYADTLVANATTEGMAAWRHSEDGSWFIQAIVYVFAKCAHRMEILDLFRQVNNLVAIAGTRTTKSEYKQASTSSSSFRRKLYLFPGMSGID
ncbi:unnamed protein product [Owenia fusiformis]|uniref:Uncharacterized protein n=1 Tax=Owenia fusiformis TaxID=6347 RepID=A0A8S4NJ91_OWEFU|nr:unnamed protein product [Owenia fusiformis]